MRTEAEFSLDNQLAGFLEEVVKTVQPLGLRVQSVALCPNYGAIPDWSGSGELAKEIGALIIDETAKAPTPLPASRQGYVVRISENHSPLIRKYIREVILYPKPPQLGQLWVQVWPFGGN